MSLNNISVFLIDFNFHSYFTHSCSTEDRKQIKADPYICGFSIHSLLTMVYRSPKKILKVKEINGSKVPKSAPSENGL
jgi:hypothetical protein